MNKQKIVVVIPARLESVRLPGKPLLDICGKPMIQHVYEKALQVKDIAKVIVATDDRTIFDKVLEFGGNPVMTSPSHQSGTDRLVEVAKHIDADIYINIQGDEPLLDPESVNTLVDLMQSEDVGVGTLHHEISSEDAARQDNVKLVLSGNKVLYFSRAKIPFHRDGPKENNGFFKHIGVYGFRKNILDVFDSLPYSFLEQSEKLEQLRFLENGIPVHSVLVKCAFPGVDTIENLEDVRAIVSSEIE